MKQTQFNPTKSSSIKNTGTKVRNYRYLVFQAQLSQMKYLLEQKTNKHSEIKSMVKVVRFRPDNEEMMTQFCALFNSIALTSPDPYEQMDETKAKLYFSNNSYIAYYLNIPVGYCIITHHKYDKIGSIAGIGIHHRYRGKGISTIILADIISNFKDEQINYIQCDILSENKASIGLFKGIGFNLIDTFRLI